MKGKLKANKKTCPRQIDMSSDEEHQQARKSLLAVFPRLWFSLIKSLMSGASNRVKFSGDKKAKYTRNRLARI